MPRRSGEPGKPLFMPQEYLNAPVVPGNRGPDVPGMGQTGLLLPQEYLLTPIVGNPTGMQDEPGKLEKAVLDGCCASDAEPFDLEEWINGWVETLFGYIDDNAISELVKKIKITGDEKANREFRKIISDLLKDLRDGAKEQVEGLYKKKEFELKFTPCKGGCTAESKVKCTGRARRKKIVKLKKAVAKHAKNLLKKVLPKEASKIADTIVNAIVDVFPFSGWLIVQPMLDVTVRCKKPACVESATLKLFIGLQLKGEGLGVVFKVGLGLNATVDLITGRLQEDAVIMMGNGDVDKEGKPGELTLDWTLPPENIKVKKFGVEVEVPNPFYGIYPDLKPLAGQTVDLLEGLGWKNRKEPYKIIDKGTQIEGMDVFRDCKEVQEQKRKEEREESERQRRELERQERERRRREEESRIPTGPSGRPRLPAVPRFPIPGPLIPTEPGAAPPSPPPAPSPAPTPSEPEPPYIPTG